MPQITIGPHRIADEFRTYEPGEVVSNPSTALVALADAGTRDPETGEKYASTETLAAPAAATPAGTTEENG